MGTVITISGLSVLVLVAAFAGIVFFCRNRRAIKNLEHQLIRDQFRTSLLNILVHDIMNPILAVRFSIENLKRHAPSDLHGYVDNSLEAIENLNQLVQRVRDLRAFDAGYKRLKYSSVSVNEMLAAIQKTFQNRLDEKGIALKMELDPKASLVDVDPVIFLSNVLNNIFDNAIKFSRKGSTIEIAACSLDEDVEFMVNDQGIGMQNDLVDSLYSGFQNKVRTIPGGDSGSGIGMMQVANYLNLAGGRIHIVSKSEVTHPEDHGTTIRIRLPKRQDLVQ